MHFKYLLISTVFFLISCGGGGDTPVPPDPLPLGENNGRITDQFQIVE